MSQNTTKHYEDVGYHLFY